MLATLPGGLDAAYREVQIKILLGRLNLREMHVVDGRPVAAVSGRGAGEVRSERGIDKRVTSGATRHWSGGRSKVITHSWRQLDKLYQEMLEYLDTDGDRRLTAGRLQAGSDVLGHVAGLEICALIEAARAVRVPVTFASRRTLRGRRRARVRAPAATAEQRRVLQQLCDRCAWKNLHIINAGRDISISIVDQGVLLGS